MSERPQDGGYTIFRTQGEPEGLMFRRRLGENLTALEAMAFLSMGTGSDPESLGLFEVVQNSSGNSFTATEFMAKWTRKAEPVTPDTVLERLLADEAYLDLGRTRNGAHVFLAMQMALRSNMELIQSLGFEIVRKAEPDAAEPAPQPVHSDAVIKVVEAWMAGTPTAATLRQQKLDEWWPALTSALAQLKQEVRDAEG